MVLKRHDTLRVSIEGHCGLEATFRRLSKKTSPQISTGNSVVSSLVRTINGSNDSRGPWRSRTLLTIFARHQSHPLFFKRVAKRPSPAPVVSIRVSFSTRISRVSRVVSSRTDLATIDRVLVKNPRRPRVRVAFEERLSISSSTPQDTSLQPRCVAQNSENPSHKSIPVTRSWRPGAARDGVRLYARARAERQVGARQRPPTVSIENSVGV